MAKKRVNITIDEELYSEVLTVLGNKGFSTFISDLLRNYIGGKITDKKGLKEDFVAWRLNQLLSLNKQVLNGIDDLKDKINN